MTLNSGALALMPALQSTIQTLRRVWPRGWSPLLAAVARRQATLQTYKAKLCDGGRIYIDLREEMCHGYFYDGDLPHEQGTRRLLEALLLPGSTFVDVGANVGFFTRMASALVGDDGHVIAVEPSPAALRLLRWNVADLANATVIDKALGATPSKQAFYVRKKGDMSSLDYDPDATPLKVEVSTLDHVLRDSARVDLIKIDVEGFERDVIAGGRKTISSHRPIVYFEYLNDFAQKHGFRIDDFQRFFADLDYRLAWINNLSDTSGLFSEQPSTYLTAIPRERDLG